MAGRRWEGQVWKERVHLDNLPPLKVLNYLNLLTLITRTLFCPVFTGSRYSVVAFFEGPHSASYAATALASEEPTC